MSPKTATGFGKKNAKERKSVMLSCGKPNVVKHVECCGSVIQIGQTALLLMI